VRRAGVTVVLSGQGGDEVFAGYPTFRRVAAAHAWRRRLPLPSWLMRAAARPLASQPFNARVAKFGQCLANIDDPLTTYLLLRQLYSADVRRALFPGGGAGTVLGLPAGVHEALHADAAGLDPVNLVSLLETRTYLANTLLRDGDVMSMAHSIELRVPFLDRRIVEAVAAMPGDAKLNRQLPKPLLLRAVDGLIPREIFARPKQGFTFPWERWLRVPLRPFADDTFRDGSRLANLGLDPSVASRLWQTFLGNQAGITWSRVWALVVLGEWARRNEVVA
jgi:asparagine synthase (glutamine-hydrolysing)